MLRFAGFRFDTHPADLPELPGAAESPAAFVRRLARAKARAVAARLGDGLPVLGADTDVSIGGRILGKPSSETACVDMLLTLSGRRHQVTTAVVLLTPSGEQERVTVTEIEFATIDAAEARAYWASGEPRDKAGGYAIQGRAARWVRSVRGSCSGVVGLPLWEACDLLRRAGIRPHDAGPAGAAP